MEILDIVDSDDNVIGQAPKNEIYEKKLLHRIVHIFVFNTEGKMALQLRAKRLFFAPDHWCTSAAGHVSAGETAEFAAYREYEEELGCPADTLEFFNKDFYSAENRPDKFLCTYKIISDGPFNPDPHEVQRVEYFTLDEIRDMIDNGEKFHPELIYLLKKYFI